MKYERSRSIFAALLIAFFILSGGIIPKWSAQADEVEPHEVEPHEVRPHEVRPHEVGPHEVLPLAVMERARAIWTIEAFHALIRWEITTEEKVTTYLMEIWMVGDDMGLIRILAPVEDAGTGYLLLGDELWYYSPLIGEAIPLPAIVLHEGLLGSGMALDDLFRGALADRYRIEFAPDQPDAGYVLHLHPFPGEPLVYGRLEVTLRADYALLMIVYYDQREGLIRTARFSELTEIDGRLVPFVVTIEEPDGDRTIQTIESLVLDPEIDPAIFTIEHLEGE